MSFDADVPLRVMNDSEVGVPGGMQPAMVAAIRAAGAWPELWQMVRLQLQGSFHGLVVTAGTGAELLNIGSMLGVPHTAIAGDVTAIGFRSVWHSADDELLHELAQEVRNARSRLGAMDISEAGSEWLQVLQSVFARTSTQIAVLDCDLRYVFVNESLAAAHGLKCSDHYGLTLREVIGEGVEAIGPVIEEVFRSGMSTGPQRFTHAYPGQPARTYQGWYAPIEVSGAVRYVSVTLREHTHAALPADDVLERCIKGLGEVIGQGAGAALLAELAGELAHAGLIGDSCVAHEVVLQRVTIARRVGVIDTVIRWRLAAGQVRVAVPRGLLGDVLISAIRAAIGFGGVVDVHSELVGAELVFVIQGDRPVQRGVELAHTSALVQLGGEVRIDGDVTVRLPVLEVGEAS